MRSAFQTRIASPSGEMRLVAEDEALVAIYFPQHNRPAWPEVAEAVSHPVLVQAVRELGEYFSGTRREFSVPYALHGTEFQRRVWAALAEIPFGATRTYLQIAQAIGAVQAVRAVGAANGRNPLSIIVPCHRVIGADGSLTGYGGGLAAKRWLLTHEQQVLGQAAGGQPRLLPD